MLQTPQCVVLNALGQIQTENPTMYNWLVWLHYWAILAQLSCSIFMRRKTPSSQITKFHFSNHMIKTSVFVFILLMCLLWRKWLWCAKSLRYKSLHWFLKTEQLFLLGNLISQFLLIYNSTKSCLISSFLYLFPQKNWWIWLVFNLNSVW